MNLGNIIQWERKVGRPIYQQNYLVVRPISRVLSVWWRPFGGAVRNWPVAVEVEENGILREIPITNVNLWAQVGISLFALFVTMIISMAGTRPAVSTED